MRATLSLLATFMLLARAAAAQTAAEPISVFLDCNTSCDSDFIRTEITYVDWVRDRAVADVHLLITSQGTAGGGNEYTLALLGQRRFAGRGDTLTFVTQQSSTPDMTRRAMTRSIQLGLVPFLARTAIASRMTLRVEPAAQGGPAPAAPRDRWNKWVYSIGFNANMNGERTQQFNSIGGNASARRTTEEWKIQLNARENYRESKFDFGGTKSTFINRTYSFDQLVVKSLGPRLSAGFRGAIGSTTFENKRLYWRAGPAVEFDIFPYSESTRRMLTLQYGVGVESFDYNEETIYFKLQETRPVHTLNISLNQNQPWGNVNVGTEAGQYLDETNRNFAAVFGGTGLRLFKGFNLNLSGHFSSIRNQLYIARRGATPEEVLLQQRRLQTNYSYFVFTGVSYTFGSVLSPVVNPRFGRSGGSSSCFCF
jgi:hypothetical protein